MTPASHATTPRAVWVLGFLGLIPFLALGYEACCGPASARQSVLFYLLGWCAAVLSFLGGARWGGELARPLPRTGVLVVSTLPALAGWLLVGAALKYGALQPLEGFALVFGLQLAWDLLDPDTPRGYRRLRTVLTVGAWLGLAMGFWGAMRG